MFDLMVTHGCKCNPGLDTSLVSGSVRVGPGL